MKLPYVCALLAAFAIQAPAAAMIVRHDVPDSAYVVDDAEYPALVDLISPGDCIGTLVHESHVLTVAHCAVDLQRGDSLVFEGTPYAVAEVILHPEWRDLDEFDIAVVRLEGSVTGVEPLPIYRGSSESSYVITLVGRGVTATGLEGEESAEADGKLRAATNAVSSVNDHFIEIVFERPGQPGVTALEGVGAAGDSGGPAFIEIDGVRYVAGLNSYGDAPGAIGIGQYGAFDYQTRVSSYVDWLDATIDFADSPSDEPSPGPDTPGSDDSAPDVESGCAINGSRRSGIGTFLLLALVVTLRRVRSS